MQSCAPTPLYFTAQRVGKERLRANLIDPTPNGAACPVAGVDAVKHGLIEAGKHLQ